MSKLLQNYFKIASKLLQNCSSIASNLLTRDTRNSLADVVGLLGCEVEVAKQNFHRISNAFVLACEAALLSLPARLLMAL